MRTSASSAPQRSQATRSIGPRIYLPRPVRGPPPNPCGSRGQTVSSPAFPEVRGTVAQDDDRDRQTERKYLRFAGVGIQFGLTIALFTLGGFWLDSKIESVRPLFTVLGLLLGFVGATTSLIYQVLGPRKKR
ncbi:MAG: AtpZ/AtpI family protein [Planctomycetota bacterium]